MQVQQASIWEREDTAEDPQDAMATEMHQVVNEVFELPTGECAPYCSGLLPLLTPNI